MSGSYPPVTTHDIVTYRQNKGNFWVQGWKSCWFVHRHLDRRPNDVRTFVLQGLSCWLLLQVFDFLSARAVLRMRRRRVKVVNRFMVLRWVVLVWISETVFWFLWDCQTVICGWPFRKGTPNEKQVYLGKIVSLSKKNSEWKRSENFLTTQVSWRKM